MKAVPIRPFDAEIFVNERRPVAVDGFGKVDGFTLALPVGLQPLDLLVKRSVNEQVKGIGTALEIVGRAAPHNDARAVLGSVFH